MANERRISLGPTIGQQQAAAARLRERRLKQEVRDDRRRVLRAAERAVIDAAMSAPWEHEYRPLADACARLAALAEKEPQR